MKLLVAACVGGLVGGAAVWIAQTGQMHLIPVGMTYAELAATLLSAVSVLLTALGLVIGLLAFLGYQQFKKVAVESAKAQVRKEVKDGDLKTHVEAFVREYLDTGFKSGDLNKMLKEILNKATYSGTERKWSEVDEAGDQE